MPITCKIDPDRIYDDGAVMLALDFPSSLLVKARREGDLRYTRKGRRVLYLGQWLLDWLCNDARNEEARRAK
jgi:hypothetical protein